MQAQNFSLKFSLPSWVIKAKKDWEDEGVVTNKKKRQRKWWGKIYLPVLILFFHLVCPHPPYPYPSSIDLSSALWGSLPFKVRTGQISPLMQTVPPDQTNFQILRMAKTVAKSHISFSRWPVWPRLWTGSLVRFPGKFLWQSSQCETGGKILPHSQMRN